MRFNNHELYDFAHKFFECPKKNFISQLNIFRRNYSTNGNIRF